LKTSRPSRQVFVLRARLPPWNAGPHPAVPQCADTSRRALPRLWQNLTIFCAHKHLNITNSSEPPPEEVSETPIEWNPAQAWRGWGLRAFVTSTHRDDQRIFGGASRELMVRR